MATTNSYYPVRIGDQIIWLRNFRNKLPSYKTPLGYADADVTAIQADCDRLVWLMETLQGAAQAFAQSVTSHLTLMKTGTGTANVDPPAFSLPATPAPPANVLPGAFKRLTTFIANLKTRPGYTDTIGQDLGVIGAVQPAPNPATTKPVIKAIIVAGGKVQVQWTKGVFDALRVEVDRGSGWQFLDNDIKPHYDDPTNPPTGAAVWKYRAIYLLNDEQFGQWSDPVSIAVQG